jgi:hypothetical protein
MAGPIECKRGRTEQFVARDRQLADAFLESCTRDRGPTRSNWYLLRSALPEQLHATIKSYFVFVFRVPMFFGDAFRLNMQPCWTGFSLLVKELQSRLAQPLLPPTHPQKSSSCSATDMSRICRATSCAARFFRSVRLFRSWISPLLAAADFKSRMNNVGPCRDHLNFFREIKLGDNEG